MDPREFASDEIVFFSSSSFISRTVYSVYASEWVYVCTFQWWTPNEVRVQTWAHTGRERERQSESTGTNGTYIECTRVGIFKFI